MMLLWVFFCFFVSFVCLVFVFVNVSVWRCLVWIVVFFFWFVRKSSVWLFVWKFCVVWKIWNICCGVWRNNWVFVCGLFWFLVRCVVCVVFVCVLRSSWGFVVRFVRWFLLLFVVVWRSVWKLFMFCLMFMICCVMFEGIEW